MPLKILLTADVHLGLKFGTYPTVQQELSNARFDALKRLVDLANEKQCELFVIAGDLFDVLGVADKDVIRATQILKEFHGKLVAVLPGNHDHIVPGDSRLWQKFKSVAGDRTLLLEEKKVYPLKHYDLDVNFYAGPCDARHSKVNSVGWIDAEPRDPSVKYHIGVAHGSLAGVSPDPDQKFFPMTDGELLNMKLDVWLMGHTDRMQYPATAGSFSRIFFPGTPEPNGFDCPHAGSAWILEIGDDKSVNAVSQKTGRYRFIETEANVSTLQDLSALEDQYADPEAKSIMLKLTLNGRLPSGDYLQLGEFEKRLAEKVMYLEIDRANIKSEITPAVIEREYTSNSFPHMLLSALSGEEKDNKALQVAYEIMKEIRP